MYCNLALSKTRNVSHRAQPSMVGLRGDNSHRILAQINGKMLADLEV